MCTASEKIAGSMSKIVLQKSVASLERPLYFNDGSPFEIMQWILKITFTLTSQTKCCNTKFKTEVSLFPKHRTQLVWLEEGGVRSSHPKSKISMKNSKSDPPQILPSHPTLFTRVWIAPKKTQGRLSVTSHSSCTIDIPWAIIAISSIPLSFVLKLLGISL